MKEQNILHIILIISLLQNIYSLQCGDEQIDNCEICSKVPSEIGTCAKCKDNYFQFLHNYMCLPCDHKTFGNPGCQGNCKRVNNNFECDEFGCKNGFYSLNTFHCTNCLIGSPNCVDCSYLPPFNTSDQRIFKCNGCIDSHYKIFDDGRCHRCYKPFCSECHFYEGTTISVCDKCNYDYYLSGGNCKRCPHYSIYGGYCRKCTDNIEDYDNIFCYCNSSYYQISPRKCEHCPLGCNTCTYDNILKKPRCITCSSGYALDKNGTCTYCGLGCGFCSINTNGSPVCYYCKGGYKLVNGKCLNCSINCEICHPDNNNFVCDRCFYNSVMTQNKMCLHCPNNCSSCELDKNSNFKCTSCITYLYPTKYYGINNNYRCELCPDKCKGCSWNELKGDFGCTDCFYGSALKDKDCLSCQSISEFDKGCQQCSYDQSKNKFRCYSCINSSYVNITNSYECKSNVEPNKTEFYGCLLGVFNYVSNKYECNKCKNDFIPIINDKKCKKPSEMELNSFCREAINIGNESNPIYSCTKCKSISYANVTDYKGVSNCFKRANELILCEKAYKDQSQNINCTKCLGNFQFKYDLTYMKNICNDDCGKDGFKKNNMCYKCDDPKFGNPGCVGSLGCDYVSSNDQLNCHECKPGYFQYSYGQCFHCKEGSSACLECHMNNDTFKCDKCIDGYILNENKKCQVEKCKEYPEVTPGCIICDKLLDDYKSKGKCQACKEGYFKTKDGSCIHCKAKKNGGPACELCGYELNQYGKETDNIICKHCPGGFITSEGKCYKCQDELEEGCQNCVLQIDQVKQTEKLICTYCKSDYILSKNNHCIHYKGFTYKIPFCKEQNDYLEKNIIKDNNITIDDYFEEDEYDYNMTNMYNNNYTYPNYNNINNNKNNKTNSTNNTKIDYNIKYEYKVHSYCNICKDGYVLKNNSCIPLNISSCSLSSFLLNDIGDISQFGGNYSYFDLMDYYKKCRNLCKGSKYINISYYYEITEQVKVYYENKDNIENFTEYNYTYYNNYTKNNNTKNYTNYNNKTQNNYNSTNNKTQYNYNSTKNSTENNKNYTNNYRNLNENNNTNDLSDEYYYDKDNYITEYSNDINSSDNKYIEAFEMKTSVYELNINTLLYNSFESITNNSQIMNIISKSYFCLDNLGQGSIYSPTNLRKCKNANYYGNNDTYVCSKCIDGYSLDEETKTCKQSIKVKMNLRPGFSNCFVRNIGTYSHPIYSCYSCYNNNDLLVTSDSGAKFCASKVGELEGCTEAYADTTYLNNVYNCTDCDKQHISYYNIFFERITCQNINDKPTKIKDINTDEFNKYDPNKVENVKVNINGTCDNNKLFTPDGKYCYACNNRTVGMVGCKGACAFDLKKNIVLKCEEGMCKTGYIEKTKGVCEPCDTINEGCIECHYENNYLPGYYGFKRKRRFSCDQCDNGYLISEDGTCHHCSTLGFDNCKNCGVDKEHDNEIICVECKPGYFTNDEGKCIRCRDNEIRGKENTCITCDDIDNGGIEGCLYCNNVNNKPQCNTCKPGFILLKNDYTCVRISSNIDLEELPHCQLALLNSENHYECVKCDKGYVLLEEENQIKCFNKEFIDSKNTDFCEIFINLGTDDKPIYSCSKCRENEYGDITKITFKENNIAFCENRTEYPSLENCTKATMIIEKGEKKLNCSECVEDNILYYHKDIKANICKYKYFEKECIVKYCKTCTPGNNYFCSVCLPADYEVSPLTGGCVKKMEKEPEVYFKDIFRYKLDQSKQIGAKKMHGPFFSLRGLTNSQINTGHAFLVLLTFKSKNSRNIRNLEEDKNVKTYCQIVESCDETDGEPNVADFDCIGDLEEEEELTNYNLTNIQESSDNNTFSNLNELIETTDLSTLDQKLTTNFTLKNFVEMTSFMLDKISNITSKNYHFDFTLNGNLSKILKEESINVQIHLNPVNKKVTCTFNIKANKKADLKCNLNLEEYKDKQKEFSLKLAETKPTDKNPSVYLTRINEVKLIQQDEDDSDNITVIIVSVVASVVVAGAGIGIGIYLYKSHKLKKLVNNNPIDNSVKANMNNKIEGQDSHRKIIPFAN